ncbi:uncharacterized protein RCH25_006566 [Pelodytes ibericus]
MSLFNLIGSIFQVPESRPQNVSIYSPKESFKGCTPKGKLRKSDISSPTNFKHVTHVGWNSLSSLDTTGDADLKKLFNLAGITDDHLRDRQMSRRIFEVIEKRGGIEAVRKETLRLTSVERTRSHRLRSLSSSNLTPSKRQSFSVVPSPCPAKIPALTYLPSLSMVPPPPPTPPPLSHFPTMSPLPPPPQYSGALSTPELAPVHKPSAGYPPIPPRPKSIKCGSVLPAPLPSDQKAEIDVALPPPPPPLPVAKDLSLEKPNPTQRMDSTTGCVPPPPPLPSMGTSGHKPPSMSLVCNGAEPPPVSPFKRIAQNTCIRKGGLRLSNKESARHNDPSLFLDQIKRGVQLKNVDQSSKTEPAQCSSIVTALMDVIKKRHKAIHSSDEDGEVEDEWED